MSVRSTPSICIHHNTCTRSHARMPQQVTIVFEVERPEQHYHVPLLLNPYGYSTYRGS